MNGICLDSSTFDVRSGESSVAIRSFCFHELSVMLLQRRDHGSEDWKIGMGDPELAAVSATHSLMRYSNIGSIKLVITQYRKLDEVSIYRRDLDRIFNSKESKAGHGSLLLCYHSVLEILKLSGAPRARGPF